MKVKEVGHAVVSEFSNGEGKDTSSDWAEGSFKGMNTELLNHEFDFIRGEQVSSISGN